MLQIVVDFTASWCPPCRLMAPIFAECAKIFTNVIFVKIDVDELKVSYKNPKLNKFLCSFDGISDGFLCFWLVCG